MKDTDRITAAWLEGLGFKQDSIGDWYTKGNDGLPNVIVTDESEFWNRAAWRLKVFTDPDDSTIYVKSQAQLLSVARALGVELVEGK